MLNQTDRGFSTVELTIWERQINIPIQAAGSTVKKHHDDEQSADLI